MPRRRDSGALNTATAEINITSLVDVAFTLLVIFIITAPILQSGVEVQVPRAAAESITTPEGVVVTVTREGQIYIGEATVQWEQFSDALSDAVQAQQVRNLYLKADEGVPYGEVLRVLAAMKELDIATVGLVADPEDLPVRGAG